MDDKGSEGLEAVQVVSGHRAKRQSPATPEVVTEGNWFHGARVRRGPAWRYGEQDGGSAETLRARHP